MGDGVVRGRRIAEMDRCLEHESLLCHEEVEVEEVEEAAAAGTEGLDFCTRQIEI